MDTQAYLRRLGLNDFNPKADLESLKLLQRRQLLSVPFENLDIHWQRKIVLDPENFYRKIVKDGRGGFCYELNGLFYELLTAFGFQCRLISARVSNGRGGFGAEYDHLTILTEIEDTEYLVDVGFGDFIAEPVRFVLDTEQQDANGTFVFRHRDGEYLEIAKKYGDIWNSEFIFKNAARDLAEFEAMCEYHQTSPESHFTRKKVCSLMTAEGRKTLTDNKFIETVNGEKSETEVTSEEEFNELLKKEFGINGTDS